MCKTFPSRPKSWWLTTDKTRIEEEKLKKLRPKEDIWVIFSIGFQL